jgi:hypothetical protein
VTKTSPFVARPVMCLAAAAAAAGLPLAVPAARAAGNAITACNAATSACAAGGLSIPSTSGVYFTVSAGGGNRDFASVEVMCKDETAATVYDTVLPVAVPAKGTGTSATILPAAGSCVATLEKQMSIGKARVLGTATFTVTS